MASGGLFRLEFIYPKFSRPPPVELTSLSTPRQLRLNELVSSRPYRVEIGVAMYYENGTQTPIFTLDQFEVVSAGLEPGLEPKLELA